MNYVWKFMTLYKRQESRPFPRKRNAKKQNGCLRRPTKSCEKKRSEREKERYTHLNAEFQRIVRGDKKAFLRDQCKEIRRKQQNGKD